MEAGAGPTRNTLRTGPSAGGPDGGGPDRGGRRDKVVVRDVSKEFVVDVNGRPVPVPALDRISFTVRDGEFVAIIGRSGCGKTTLLRIIMGLEPPLAGHIEIDGRRVTGPGHDRGMVFQHAELLPWRTALGNVEFGLEVKGIPPQARRERALRYVELVGLRDAVDRRPYQLSGGMQQRAGMARALATDPEVLLMDEPFGELDAQTRETLQGELLRIHAQTRKTIVLVTHDVDEAVLLADRILILSPQPGRVREEVVVDLPRPRADPGGLRASSEFAARRHHVWRSLTAAPDG